MSEPEPEPENAENEAETEYAENVEMVAGDPVRRVSGDLVIAAGRGVSHADDPIDYGNVVVDRSKPYDELSPWERRRILFDRMEQAGHPDAMPHTQRELADEFGVSQGTITDDVNRIREFVAASLSRKHYHIMDSVFRGALLDLVDEGKYAWAAELGKEWFEWLADVGAVERTPDRLDLDATVREAEAESDEYEIVADDEADADRDLAELAEELDAADVAALAELKGANE